MFEFKTITHYLGDPSPSELEVMGTTCVIIDS